MGFDGGYEHQRIIEFLIVPHLGDYPAVTYPYGHHCIDHDAREGDIRVPVITPVENGTVYLYDSGFDIWLYADGFGYRGLEV